MRNGKHSREQHSRCLFASGQTLFHLELVCTPVWWVEISSNLAWVVTQVVSMSRYRGPRLRIVRRLGELPGLTQKTPQRQAPPGQHGATTKKPTQYGVRLMEKQKLRYNYGVTEHQLINYVKKARSVTLAKTACP